MKSRGSYDILYKTEMAKREDMTVKKYNENKARLAGEYFMKGYNCSQAVVAAWAEDVGLDMQTAMRISCGFGGGMGRLREVCGSVSGAVMILGLKFGYTDGSDQQAKGEMYKLIQAFAARFKEENGFDSIVCRELLGLPGASTPQPAQRNGEYYKKRPCRELVELSAGLLGEFVEVQE